MDKFKVMTMNVLVTGGGAGYIGSALIKKLLDEGHRVVSIDNLSRGDYKYLKKYEENPRLKLVVRDVCDLEKLEEVLKESGDVDAVVHLAAIPGIMRCQENPENIFSPFNLESGMAALRGIAERFSQENVAKNVAKV